MKYNRAVLLAIFVVATSLITAPSAQAISLRSGVKPAEQPPAGYSADTYVDSRGCLYIRAGRGAEVNWVPRVTRDRQVLCGQSPSVATGVAKAATTKPVAPASTPKPVSTPKSATTTKASVAKPISLLPTSKPQRRTATSVAAAPLALPAVQNTGKAKPVTRNVQIQCVKNGAKTARLSTGQTIPVHCSTAHNGPISYKIAHANGDVTSVVTMPVKGQVVRAVAPQRAAQINPVQAPVAATFAAPAMAKAMAKPRAPQLARMSSGSVPLTYAAAMAQISAPIGYSPIWQDDRLNPQRGVQTAAGTQQMRQIWTDTVPRRLVNAAVSQAAVSGSNRPVMLVNTGSSYVSTKSAAPLKARSKRGSNIGSSHQFVQVGTYANAGNAKRVTQQLQSLGYQVASLDARLRGTKVDVILAGPFAKRGELKSALQTLRGSGFHDAFTRR